MVRVVVTFGKAAIRHWRRVESGPEGAIQGAINLYQLGLTAGWRLGVLGRALVPTAMN